MVPKSKKPDLDWPVWYEPSSPLGSAVRYVASLSSRFNWVGISLLKGKTLKLGPHLGAERQRKSELVVIIRDPAGKIKGQFEIDSRIPQAFSPEDEAAVTKVAKELGELWPE